MTFIPTIHAVKVTILGSILGQQVVITISIGTPSSPSTGLMEDIGEAVEDWLTTELLDNLCDDYTFNEIKMYDLTSDTAPVVSRPVSLAGAVATNPVPNNVSIVTTFLTANRGRSGRGRQYMAGSPNTVGDAISTSSGQAAALAGGWANLNTYLDPLGCEHIVISNFSGGSARSEGLKQPVLSYRTNVDYDSQRRRLAGRGL